MSGYIPFQHTPVKSIVIKLRFLTFGRINKSRACRQYHAHSFSSKLPITNAKMSCQVEPAIGAPNNNEREGDQGCRVVLKGKASEVSYLERQYEL